MYGARALTHSSFSTILNHSQLGMPNILNPHGHIDAGATECADWQELWCARGSFRK